MPAKWLPTFLKDMHAEVNQILLVGVYPRLVEVFKMTGFDKLIGEDNIFPTKPAHWASIDAAWELVVVKISDSGE